MTATRHRPAGRSPLLPHLFVADFLGIDFARLGRSLFLILDVDNTIARLRAPDMEPGVLERLAFLRQEGIIQDVALVSNVIFGGGRRRRVERFARMLAAHAVVAGPLHPKPSPRPFREAMRLMGADPSRTVVVGDQVYTDVLGGNRLGLVTVLVRPLGPDHWATGLTGRRWRERRVLKGAGLLPPG